MATDAAGLIETLGCAPVAVIGYSMGAFVAQELALARPALLRGVALLGTLGRKNVFRRALFDATLHGLRSGVRLLRHLEVVTRALQLFAPARLDDERWAGAYLDRALAADGPAADGRRGLLGQQEATTAYDDRLEALAAITLPTLVMSFELDLLVPAVLT
jgi:pimeloyl-ACP methyl ester carboxylesterase